MKVLFDHPWPFALAHGGLQIQIEQTMLAVGRQGAEVEHLRWWDAKQCGDVIHYFGRPPVEYIQFAQAKGLKVVVAELLSGVGSRPTAARRLQKAMIRISQAVLPQTFTSRLAWDAYRCADGFIANTPWEAQIMTEMFGAKTSRIHIVANGVEETFFRTHQGGGHLVCTAAIHPRKRIVELAAACARAHVPVWIVGRPYADTDPYFQRFLRLQKQSPNWIRYEGGVTSRSELAGIYAAARGFVLLSTQETLSLSSFEAAAAGCPLLLSELPWAQMTFGPDARYVSLALGEAGLAAALRRFYDEAPTIPATFHPPTWDEVGAQFVAAYRQVMAND